ncbi:MAG: HAD family hydrolase [Promethearchaeota archaeon]
MTKCRYKAQQTIKSVIFDLDGTLVFFKIDYMAARQEIIKNLYEHGIPKSLVSINQRIMEVINIAENYLKIVVKTSDKIPMIKNQIEKIITKYEMDGANKTNLIPGAKDLLVFLKKQRYKLGLFTLENRKITQFILNKFSIKSFFDSVVTRDDVLNLKPHPDHLRKVIMQLGVLPYEIVVVGDSPVDLECAKQIDALAIARLSEYHKSDELFKAGADFVVENLLEINTILKEMV